MEIQKNHKVISVIIGLIFLIVLQEFTIPSPVFRFLALAFMLFLILVTIYNYWYLKSLSKINYWVLLRPLLLFSGLFGVFLLVPNTLVRGWFLLLSVFLVSGFEYFLGNFSEQILLLETLTIAFCFFISFTAYNQYFPVFHSLYVVGVFFTTLLSIRALYEFLPKTENYKNISATAISLFCTEIFWALTFLPFHYSALALLLFNVFYFFVILHYYSTYNILNLKKIQFHLLLMVVLVAWTLVFTPWNILS